jgi:hypothetical protein
MFSLCSVLFHSLCYEWFLLHVWVLKSQSASSVIPQCQRRTLLQGLNWARQNVEKLLISAINTTSDSTRLAGSWINPTNGQKKVPKKKHYKHIHHNFTSTHELIRPLINISSGHAIAESGHCLPRCVAGKTPPPRITRCPYVWGSTTNSLSMESTHAAPPWSPHCSVSLWSSALYFNYCSTVH